MSERTFIDNSEKVKNELEKAYIAWLYEAGGEIEAQTKQNSAVGIVGGSHTKEKWQYKVDENKMEVIIGNTQENAVWEEFGTGDYALNGDGRQGGWWIPIGYGEGEITPEVVSAYHFTVRGSENGPQFAYTKGKKPKRSFYKAYISKKKAVQQALSEKLKGL